MRKCTRILLKVVHSLSGTVPTLTSSPAMILWSIWKYRNDKLLNNVDRLARVNIFLSSVLLQQWIYARTLPHIHRWWSQLNKFDGKDHLRVLWIASIDAALFKEACKTGVAVTIRDSHGEFMVCRMPTYHGLLLVREAEAKALLDAIFWVVSLKLQYIIFETDSILVGRRYRLKFGSILAACCSLLSQ